jgi:hypothetical protein
MKQGSKFDGKYLAYEPSGGNHGRRNFKDTNLLMSSSLVVLFWGGEAIL